MIESIQQVFKEYKFNDTHHLAEAIAKRLQNETQVLTCVYCGKAYEPGTPRSNHEALTEHILQCEKHPVFQLKTQFTAAMEALGIISGMMPCSISDLIGRDLYQTIYGAE